jgi:hypothetical protein
MSHIGTLNEKPLHAALKEWYAQPGDRFEASVDGFFVDIVRDDLLIEIQTKNFSSIKNKLHTLAENHALRLVYPIAREKWIVRLARNGRSRAAGRRRSPKRGALEHVFSELVSIPRLIANPNFSLEVLFIHEEEVRRFDARRRWRRSGWVTQERRLLDVVGHLIFTGPEDLQALIPSPLTEPWTTADLAGAISQPRWLAQKMVYCMRESGAAKAVGKRGNAILYT